MADANARANENGPRAEYPDRFHGTAVREAVAAGGSSADVPDERAKWAELVQAGPRGQAALRPLLEVAWRDLKAAIVANTTEALAAIEPTVEASATVYGSRAAMI
jgi:hypothetical protein